MEAKLFEGGVASGLAQLDVPRACRHVGPRRRQAPEQRLMSAVLTDAMECVEKNRFATDARRRGLFLSAERWFLVHESDWPYSFECICWVLGLDSNAVRTRLRLGLAPQRAVATDGQPFSS